MQSTFKMERNKRIIRHWLVFFMIMLALSGITAMPAEWELSIAVKFFDDNSYVGNWLNEIYVAVRETGKHYPYLFYGYDWLGFAHLIIAIAFIGPYKDPVKNKWVIEFGIIASVLIIPFALVAGHFRSIPLWWRLIDCSFGVIGLFVLGISEEKIAGTAGESGIEAIDDTVGQ